MISNEKRREALKKFLEKKPRQMNSLCAKAGISRASITNFLAGRSSSLQMDTYDKLAKAAGVPVTVLLGEEIQTNTATEGHDPVLLEILENMLDQAINRDEIDLSKKERKELIEAVYAVAQKHLRSGINITNHRLMRDIGREISDRVLKDHD